MKQIIYALFSLVLLFIVTLFISVPIGMYMGDPIYAVYSTVVVTLVGIVITFKYAPED